MYNVYALLSDVMIKKVTKKHIKKIIQILKSFYECFSFLAVQNQSRSRRDGILQSIFSSSQKSVVCSERALRRT